MHTTLRARRSVPLPTSSTSLPQHYIWVPLRLLDQLSFTPLAIGLYLMIARIWLAQDTDQPVPLSDEDLVQLDPRLSRGALRPAIAYLIAYGYLIKGKQGRKTTYQPAWGRIRGTTRLWSKGAASLGRGSIATIRVDRAPLDTAFGRLTPNPSMPATIVRYVVIPTLTIRQVGEFALAAHRTGTAPTITPADTLARGELTLKGMQHVGLLPFGSRPAPRAETRSRVFVCPPDLIGNLIGNLIDDSTPPNPPSRPLHGDEISTRRRPP